MKYKCLIFDLDGTLLDSLQGILDAINLSFKDFNIPVVRTYEEGKTYIGAGSIVFATRALKGIDIDPETKTKILDDFLKYYAKTQQISAKPFDGLEKVLLNLKKNGYLLAVASNKPQMLLEPVIKQAFPNVEFDFALGQKPNAPAKPDPHVVFQVFKNLKLDADDCVYVGDSEYDYLTAKNAGINCIICKYGYGFYDEPWFKKIKYIVNSVDELEKMLLD